MTHSVHDPAMLPRLRITVGGASRDFTDPVVALGRGQDLAVVVAHPDVSRRHLEFRRTAQGWFLVDLQSTNGTWLAGRRITHERVPDTHPVLVNLGGTRGPQVRIEVVAPQVARPVPPPVPPTPAYAPTQAQVRQPAPQPTHQPAPQATPQPPPGHLAHGATVVPMGHPTDRVLTIGRSRTCDIVIDDPLVSRQHATLELGATPVLRDLDSFNGTFVNGYRLGGATRLQPGDEVIFGNQSFSWTGNDLSSKATRADLTLFAENLHTVVKGGKRLLEGVSFQLEPSSLTAVIGPSGSGKSTLLGALTGLNPATHGAVVWQGHDLYSHYEQLRFQIGLVPQSDIQHPQLTVRQGLTYAAMLRLPPDTTPAERAQRVQDVVGQMQLNNQIDNRIGTQLSGGQRKRVSIATELLTAPPLLFLDEPTSGLDPGLDRDVMHQLRRLADEGRVVMVVTHSVLALDVCDNVLVLAPGGRMAYFGPPAGVLEHFGCRDYPQVFDLLDEPDLWQRIPPPPSHSGTQQLPALAGPGTAPPLQSLSRQLVTLVRRNLAVTVADRMLLAMLVFMPLVLGALSRVVQGDAGLSMRRTRHGPENLMSHSESLQRLTILIVAAALMGTAVTIRELVKERPIFQREYAVGLSPGVYLASKVIVLGTACFVQGVLVTFLALAGLPGPDHAGVLGLGVLEIAFAIGLVAFTMAVVGLAVSALVTSNEQTMPALVGVVMVQLVLCGALVPVAGRAVLEQLAWLAPARWGFAASAVSVDLDRAKRQLPDEQLDGLYDPNVAQYVLDLTMLVFLLCVLLALAAWFVRRSATARD
jgi:ABC-type multidrug transport system ATPase subunit/pSer/pThr/pTyr-binding forkhead associated (FHA) protein